jgi:predicted DNA binding CopG/RHH family protein
MKKTLYFNIEEQKLAESLENENWISDLDTDDKKRYEDYARFSLKKSKRINIRMPERDLKKIQAKAVEEGLPYQSLISMLIHKYNEGKILMKIEKST